jgi:hypothetical protein
MSENPPQLPPAQKSMGQDAGVRLLLPVGRSVWAIMAGYFGLLSIIPIFAIPALVCGFVAIADIKKSATSPNPKHGMGRAVFGIIMGFVGIGIGVLLILRHFLAN